MMNRADARPDPNASAPAPWIQSPPSPQGLPSRHPHDGEHRPRLAGPRIFRHPHGGRGGVGPSTLSVTAVEDAPPPQTHSTARTLVDTKNLLIVVHVPVRAEDPATTRLKETHARPCVRRGAPQSPTMRGLRPDGSRDTARSHQAEQILGIGVVQRKIATGNTGSGMRAVVDVAILHGSLSHRESAV